MILDDEHLNEEIPKEINLALHEEDMVQEFGDVIDNELETLAKPKVKFEEESPI